MLSSTIVLGLVVALSVANAQVPPFNETCETDAYPPKHVTRKVATYVINLDLPGKQRWTQLASEKKLGIKNILGKFKDFIKGFGMKNSTVIDVIKFVDEKGAELDETLPAPFADELKGIAAATGLKLGEVVLYNIFYEVFTVCTSIVAEDPSGKLYHARNLDFGLFLGWDVKNNTWEITEALRPLIVNLDFHKGGKLLYRSVNYAGYVGILTAVRPNLFTLSMNERFSVDGGYIGFIEWIMGMRGGHWMGFLTRNTMEFATSYEDAKARLTNTEMLAPAYFILGGNSSGQGCVITRDRESAVDTWQMKDAGGWYILETNYDHWKAPLFLDDRRTPANNCMKKMTRARVSIAGIFNVLSSKPVLNKLTTYTALMQVNTGHLETWLQNCPDPCWPW